jgi:hypothetical protein
MPQLHGRRALLVLRSHAQTPVGRLSAAGASGRALPVAALGRVPFEVSAKRG